MPVRVRASNWRAKSSSCTGISVWRGGKMWPSPASRPERPRTISRYFSPRGDRGRIVKLVSTGRSPAEPSTLTAISAPARPSGSLTLRIVRTKPIRRPPSRTSEPLVSAAALSALTFTSSVGANGRPLFAL